MINKPLKYHCPDHTNRAPHCAIGEYTPCRECYYKFRKLPLPPEMRTEHEKR